jgi:hypothetical protein
MFRRTRAELGLPVERHCRILPVTLSAAERRLHRLLERYTSQVWEAAAGGRSPADARLAMIVLRKRAASGTWSLLASLTRRLRGLAGAGDAAGAQMPLPFEDDDGREAADDEPGPVLSAPGLADSESERHILERLVDLARGAVEHDSKSRVLARLLRRVREPAIVFTEYRDTLSHLAGISEGQAGVAMIHGGMDRTARADVVRAFNRGAANLLLATDAAAHGLNLQSRCRLVISLELPWNPVRLEQRIGRVDRIGQKRTVHAVHLVARHTGEEEILARLGARIARASRAVGCAESPLGILSEADVAEAVFARRRCEVSPPAHGRQECAPVEAAADTRGEGELVVRRRLVAAARVEAERLRQIRALAARQHGGLDQVAAGLVRSGPWWTTLRLRVTTRAAMSLSGALSRGSLLALFQVEMIDGRGLLVDRSVSVFIGPLPARWTATAGAVASLVGSGAPGRAALDLEVARWAERRLGELRNGLASRLVSASARERAIAEATDRIPAVACQPGLFDRRALRQADEDRRARLECRAEEDARIELIAQAANVSLAAPPRLVLVAVLDPVVTVPEP